MRSSLRRAERCLQTVGDRYSEYLATLSEDGFAAEFRRLFVGKTRAQVVTFLSNGEKSKDCENGDSLSAFLDKVFEGRKRL